MENDWHLQPENPDRQGRGRAVGRGRRWSFELRIRPKEAATFQVHLLSSPAGDEVAELQLPFPMRCADGVMEALEASVRGDRRHLAPEPTPLSEGGRGTPHDSLVEIGASLFRALFPAPVRRRWDECVEEVGERPGAGLRLVLKSDPTCGATADLHRLPWELLRDPRSGEFLALSRKTQPIRQLALDQIAVLDVPAPATKLRILVVLSCPSGVESLDLARERRKIEEAVAERSEIELQVLANPTFGEVTETLRCGGFHVLHYMGHGAFDRATGEGRLIVADADGGAAALPAERLAQVIRDVDTLRLVVLNACDTGRSATATEQPFTGLAHALLRGGVPAVLAMQLPIPDGAAIELSRVFYRHLAAGEAVDEALAEARVAVYAAERDGGFGAWAIPVLFVRRPELAIFRPRQPADEGPGPWRRWLPVAVLLLLVAGIVSLFHVKAPWAGVELDVTASRVAFTLDEPRSVVDALALAELAVPDLQRFRHPDPAAGTDRTVSADQVAAERLGVLARVSGASSGGLSLDDSCLPARTRVELERVGPRDLRLALEPAGAESSGCGEEVTASVGQGVTLRLVPGPSEARDLGAGGTLSMTPRDGRIVLDLTLAAATRARFHTPLIVAGLQFSRVQEEVAGGSSTLREVSTLRSGTVTLRPLGGGEPAENEVEPEEPVSLDGVSGRITRLELDEEDEGLLRVHFRGRAQAVTGWDDQGNPIDFMPTWSQSPWIVRLGTTASVLVAALGLFGQVGGLLRWGAARRPVRSGNGRLGPEPN